MRLLNSIRLFRYAGIEVFLHWTWFVVALIEINARVGRYSSPLWNVIEYLSLFVIILLHEFGHSLACRQVGGTANRIILWPLGGVAYVNPPQRAGATLWSIAAGPLVNVVFFVLLTLAGVLLRPTGWATTMPNAHNLLRAVWFINLGLLIFNLLPVYPLDGGQILRSLLWFVLGRARSLMAAVVIGFLGVAGLILWALGIGSVWLGVIAVYILFNCVGGWQQARALLKIAKLPRREGFLCPACKAAPPIGDVWRCHQCKTVFDTFQSNAVCPSCKTQFPVSGCTECGQARPIGEWMAARAMSTAQN